MNFIIPEAAIIRLSVYSRYLEQLKRRGIVNISSGEIAQGVGIKAAQIRKDLSYFGKIGTNGVGYNIHDLHQHILRTLGLDAFWSVSLVGYGNLGIALCSYKGFKERGFQITSIFDNDLKKIGKIIHGIEIMGIENLEEVVKKNHTQIGIISVPANAAQTVADSLVRSGVKGIISFATTVINVPSNIEIRYVNLTANLEMLTFHMLNKENYSQSMSWL